jgi:hypothetical protein
VILARRFSEKKGNSEIVKGFFTRCMVVEALVYFPVICVKQNNVFLKTHVSGN